MVREDWMKIKDRWFRWNVESKFVSGKEYGRSEQIKIYGDKINALNSKCDGIMLAALPKN